MTLQKLIEAVRIGIKPKEQLNWNKVSIGIDWQVKDKCYRISSTSAQLIAPKCLISHPFIVMLLADGKNSAFLFFSYIDLVRGGAFRYVIRDVTACEPILRF